MDHKGKSHKTCQTVKVKCTEPMMTTKIVGLAYYNGMFPDSLWEYYQNINLNNLNTMGGNVSKKCKKILG